MGGTRDTLKAVAVFAAVFVAVQRSHTHTSVRLHDSPNSVPFRTCTVAIYILLTSQKLSTQHTLLRFDLAQVLDVLEITTKMVTDVITSTRLPHISIILKPFANFERRQPVTIETNIAMANIYAMANSCNAHDFILSASALSSPCLDLSRKEITHLPSEFPGCRKLEVSLSSYSAQ